MATVGTATIVFLFVSIAVPTAAPSSIFQCAEHLEVPLHVMPRLGESRRLAVKISLSANAQPRYVAMTALDKRGPVHPSLQEEISTFFKEMSRYRRRCASKTFTIVLDAILEGDPARNPAVRVVFKSPNTIQFRSAPQAPIDDVMP